MTPITINDGVLFAALAIACYTDIRWNLLANWLTLPLVVVGLILGAVEGRFADAAFGLAVAFAIHFTLWVLKVQRGGDSKLMMGIGAVTGWSMMVESTLWKYIVFLPVGFAILAARGRLPNFVAAAKWTFAKAQGQDAGERPEPTYIAYAPAIAAGFLLARFTHLLDLG